MPTRERPFQRRQSSQGVGYAAAVLVPVAITFAVAWLELPPFLFEHAAVLLVVAIAVPWGLGPAAVTAFAAVIADNVLLREPFGKPTITGYRDLFDLVLFAAMAMVVSGLVRRAHTARLAAERAAERERRAREERDRLIATVSHDLATPLTVLNGTVQLAQRFGANPDVDLSRLFARLEIATTRATSLVKTLADAQALDTDELVLSLTTLDLRTLVGRIVEMMDRVSERHPVVLAAPDAPVMVRGDEERLQRVVENLVSNAIKYSPDGGAVEVSIALENREAVLRVRDYGIGISSDALPRIFERSYRAPEAAATAPGLGLGLKIAEQVVARHGGRIQAQPASPGGTVVSVHLPVASASEDGAHAEAAPEGVTLEPARARRQA